MKYLFPRLRAAWQLLFAKQFIMIRSSDNSPVRLDYRGSLRELHSMATDICWVTRIMAEQEHEEEQMEQKLKEAQQLIKR